MKTRTVNKLALGTVLIMATLAMNSAFADGTKTFKMRFAGGFVQNIQQMQVDVMGVPTGMLESRSMAFVKGRGTLGRFDGMVIAVGGPPVSDKSCAAGLVKVVDIVENNLVATFGDLSVLYGNGTGIVCWNPADPTAEPVAEIEGTWDGGTGRFAHAGGEWLIQFNFAERVGPNVGPDTQFVAETGVIKGHITGLRHHNRDDD